MSAHIVDSDRFHRIAFVLMFRLLWLRAQIWGYNFSFVRAKLMRPDNEGWDVARADAAIEGLRRYLFLTQVADFSAVPLQDVDAAWHHFILHTQEYRVFCSHVFGYFLDHRPASEGASPEERDRMRENRGRTAALYTQMFGESYGEEAHAYCGKCGCTPNQRCGSECGATPAHLAACDDGGPCSTRSSMYGATPQAFAMCACGCDDNCGAQPSP